MNTNQKTSVSGQGIVCVGCLAEGTAARLGRFLRVPEGWLTSPDGEAVCGPSCAALLEHGDDAGGLAAAGQLDDQELDAITDPAGDFAQQLAVALGEAPGPDELPGDPAPTSETSPAAEPAHETLAALAHEAATDRGDEAAEE